MWVSGCIWCTAICKCVGNFSSFHTSWEYWAPTYYLSMNRYYWCILLKHFIFDRRFVRNKVWTRNLITLENCLTHTATGSYQYNRCNIHHVLLLAVPLFDHSWLIFTSVRVFLFHSEKNQPTNEWTWKIYAKKKKRSRLKCEPKKKKNNAKFTPIICNYYYIMEGH